MSLRYKGGFIQAFFDPLQPGTLEPALWMWGNNTYGELAQNNTIRRSSPVQVGSSTDWSVVSGGYYYTTAVKTNGTLWAWGYNPYAQLGINAPGNQSSPIQVGSLTNWARSFSMTTTTAATKIDGSLWLVGNNSYGQLGQNDTINRSSPVQVGTSTNWVSASGGFRYVISTKTDGTLWAWGSNSQGQLGLNIAYTISRSSPVQIGAQNTWLKLACGTYSSMATKTDGTLWAWGWNDYGQLGQNNRIKRSSPVQIGALTTWSDVSASGSSVIALKTDGTLWSWGRNNGGQLGLNIAYTISRSSPVQIGSLTSWSYIAMGDQNAGAIKSDGTLWVWGNDNRGQLGQNTAYVPRSSPVQVGTLTSWKTVTIPGSAIAATLNQ